LAKSIQASAFIETSAKYNEKVTTVFNNAADLVVNASKNKAKSKRRCSLI